MEAPESAAGIGALDRTKGEWEARRSATVPRLLTLLATASTAAIGAGFFVEVNLALLVAAIGRIRAARFER